MNQTRSILVVEDDADLCDALANAIQTLGYTVHMASNGWEALQWIKQGHQPDLILLDLMMPVMNGWDFCILRRDDPRTADIPVILLSGSQHTGNHAAVLGAWGYLEKPVELGRLQQLLSTALIA